MREKDLFESYVEDEEESEEGIPRKDVYTGHREEETIFKSVVLNKNTVDLLMKVDPFRTLSDLIVKVVDAQKMLFQTYHG